MSDDNIVSLQAARNAWGEPEDLCHLTLRQMPDGGVYAVAFGDGADEVPAADYADWLVQAAHRAYDAAGAKCPAEGHATLIVVLREGGRVFGVWHRDDLETREQRRWCSDQIAALLGQIEQDIIQGDNNAV